MYKASNGRLIQRRGNGRFRATTLQDFGVASTDLAHGSRRCKACGCVWQPILVAGHCPECDACDSEAVEAK